jgi:hypothetical protein
MRLRPMDRFTPGGRGGGGGGIGAVGWSGPPAGGGREVSDVNVLESHPAYASASIPPAAIASARPTYCTGAMRSLSTIAASRIVPAG